MSSLISTANGMQDPDQLAIVYVQQFLAERGFPRALRALEEEAGLLYDETKVARSGQLMQLVWQQLESSLDSSANQNEEAAEDEVMLQSTGLPVPQALAGSIEGLHPMNILCVKLIPGQEAALTGSGDGCIRRLDLQESTAVWATHVGGGGALCMDLHPWHVSTLAAVGSMDGSVSLVHAATGYCLARSRSHSKYAGAVAWVRDGTRLVSCSYDHSVVIHRFANITGLQQQQQQQQQQKNGGEEDCALLILRRVEFSAVVQHVAALHDQRSVVLAVRDSNYLRILDTHSSEESSLHKVNINASEDDHISFFACHVAVSPCGRLLLVSTDKGRLLVLRRNIVGECHCVWRHCPGLGHMQLAVEQFHNFSAAWHADSLHVFAAAAGAQVWVMHVGTGKVKAKLCVHKVNVRGMDFDGCRLATCSFDKTLKIMTLAANTVHNNQTGSCA